VGSFFQRGVREKSVPLRRRTCARIESSRRDGIFWEGRRASRRTKRWSAFEETALTTALKKVPSGWEEGKGSCATFRTSRGPDPGHQKVKKAVRTSWSDQFLGRGGGAIKMREKRLLPIHLKPFFTEKKEEKKSLVERGPKGADQPKSRSRRRVQDFTNLKKRTAMSIKGAQGKRGKSERRSKGYLGTSS